MSELENRSEGFRRNVSLESLLSELNTALACSESELLARYGSESSSKFPPIFIMGPLRSGTTLFMQWLAASGLVAYPTNLLARFYNAPGIGALIQLMLCDERFNFRDEFSGVSGSVDYDSENGKTRGILSPNEFWYFWRRFLPDMEGQYLTNNELHDLVDTASLAKELQILTQIFEKPFAMKGMILNYNIPFLQKLFPQAIFVQIKRDPVANVASVLEARRRQYGSIETWYSFRIPEYEQLTQLAPIDQCVGQVQCINQAISAGMKSVSKKRSLIVDYDEFCGQPEVIYRQLLLALDHEMESATYHGPKRFSRRSSLDQSLGQRISESLENFNMDNFI